MKKIYAIFYCVSLILLFRTEELQSQVFTGSNGSIANNGQYTTFYCSVSGLSQSTLDGTFGVEEICLDITHTQAQDLSITLRSPSGREVELTSVNGGSGDNYSNTCFNGTSSNHISSGTPPFSGSFRPEGFIGNLNENQPGNGTWKLLVKDWMINSENGNLNSWSIKFSYSPVQPLIFQSSNLPIVIINSNNQTIQDEPKVIVDMGIINNGVGVRNYTTDTWNAFSGKIAIEYRGSSSQQYEKKSYGFETKTSAGTDLKVSLLGMPPEQDWILYAPYLDRALIRNYITYGLSNMMGNYAARGKFVELVIDGEYRGVYVLMEKIKRDGDRIDVSKLEPTDNSGDDLTGGYIIKLDKLTGSGGGGWYSNYVGNTGNIFLQYHYPKDTEITTSQMDYIQSYVDSFETALFGPNFTDPVTGYKKYADLNLLVDYFIMTEISRNVDGYRLSTFIHKDKLSKGGKLKLGPLWDYDLAWGNCDQNNGNVNWGWHFNATDQQFPYPKWYQRLMQDNEFKNALNCRYNELRDNVLSTSFFNNYVDSLAGFLNESQQRNFIMWPVLGTNLFPLPNPAPSDYQGEITRMKNWFSSRTSWMDSNIPGLCSVTTEEYVYNSTFLKVYPNPSTSMTCFEFTLPVGKEVTIKLYDITGKTVSVSDPENFDAGTHKVHLKHSLAPGLYAYELSTENSKSTGKLVITKE